MSDIKFTASVDSKKGEVSLSKLDKGIDKVGKSTQRAAGGFKALASKLAVGVAAFYAASRALSGLVRWMGDAVEKAGIQEMAEKEVAAALESTGREVEKNTEHFKQYASEIQQATVYGDEQILSAQALMIQLTKLSRDGLDAATKGAIGLASVYKTDLKAAATLVGKALAGNYGALSRYGLTVERTATAEEKRAQLLEQLLVMYQRAEAETDTYQGSIKQLANVYGDLKEEVGKAVTENEAIRMAIKDISEAILKFIESGKLEKWISDISLHISAMMEAAKWAGKAIKDTHDFIDGLIGKEKEITSVEEEMARAMAEAMKLRKSLIVDEILTIEEWSEIFNKHGRNYARVMRAISVLPEYEEIRNQWKEIKDKVIDVTSIPDKEHIIKIIPTIEMPEFDFPMLPSEIIAEDIEKLGMVIETDLVAEMDKIDITAKEATEDVLKSLGLWLEGTGEAYEEHKKQIKDMTDFEQMALAEMMGSYQGIIGTILSVIEKWAIGEIVKHVMIALPFPANLLATAGAIATVKAIFAGIKGMEKGGWVGERGPEIIKVGEKGREYLVSNEQIRNVNTISNEQTRNVSTTYNQGGMRIMINQYVTFKNLDQYSIRQSGAMLKAEVDRQLRRGL